MKERYIAFAVMAFVGSLICFVGSVNGQPPSRPTPNSVKAQTASSPALRGEIRLTMRSAAQSYRRLAVHGGYVYFYSLDGKQRWGEGLALPSQVWVQPPGTPTVGMAFLKAYHATKAHEFLDAAVEAAEALEFGQLRSGGWSNSIDLAGRDRGAKFSGGQRRRDGNSSLDDGQTQSAIQFMVLTDQALGFKNQKIHKSALLALNSLLNAQFPNGGFPQVWKEPVSKQPVKPASFPKYNWRTDGRIKNYWDMYTLNDNVCGYVAQALITAHMVYRDDRYFQALERLGDFLLLAQLPEPQPGWAQQYSFAMHPIWARKFEPAAVAGDETQEVIETLLLISSYTKNKKFLDAIPRAIAYLKRSLLKDGRLARYYELKTNRPLYMSRQGKTYSLTYSDQRLPSHYGWKSPSRIEELERSLRRAQESRKTVSDRLVTLEEVTGILAALDEKHHWKSKYRGERLVGQAKMRIGELYLSSQVFSDNMSVLADYLTQNRNR